MNKVCKDVAGLSVSGNKVPMHWFKSMTYKTNKGTEKAHILAILILADIIYWYTPTKVDSKQKFRADKLQKSYREYAEIFGSTRISIKRAIDYLVHYPLISREFRDIKVTNKRLSNVMYLEPIVNEIKKINSKHVIKSNDTLHKKIKTYTETTHSEITHELKKRKRKKSSQPPRSYIQKPYYQYVNNLRRYADKYKKMEKPFILKFEEKLYDFEFKDDGNHFLRNHQTKKILTITEAEYIYKILNHRGEIPIHRPIQVEEV